MVFLHSLRAAASFTVAATVALGPGSAQTVGLSPPNLSTFPSRLWATSPGSSSSAIDIFANGYPIGNGRLGAMLLGSPTSDQLNLNEDSLWSGTLLKDRVNPDAL